MFVVRCRCVDYVGGKEVRGVGYLDKNCRVSTDPSQAHKFTSEAEAWDFAATSGELGYDEQGLFCWAEPEKP